MHCYSESCFIRCISFLVVHLNGLCDFWSCLSFFVPFASSNLLKFSCVTQSVIPHATWKVYLWDSMSGKHWHSCLFWQFSVASLTGKVMRLFPLSSIQLQVFPDQSEDLSRKQSSQTSTFWEFTDANQQLTTRIQYDNGIVSGKCLQKVKRRAHVLSLDLMCQAPARPAKTQEGVGLWVMLSSGCSKVWHLYLQGSTSFDKDVFADYLFPGVIGLLFDICFGHTREKFECLQIPAVGSGMTSVHTTLIRVSQGRVLAQACNTTAAA